MFITTQVSKFPNAQWGWRPESGNPRTRNHKEITKWTEWKSINLKKSVGEEDLITIFRIGSDKKWNERERARSTLSQEGNDQVWRKTEGNYSIISHCEETRSDRYRWQESRNHWKGSDYHAVRVDY